MEDSTDDTPVADTPQETPGEATREVDDKPLGEGGIKALNAERDARKAADAKVHELEQALQAATQQGAEKDTEVARLTTMLAKSEVMRTKGLSPELAEFLTGTTKEELEASADRLLAALPKSEPAASDAPKPLGVRPDPNIGGGDQPLNGDGLEDALKAALGI